MKSFNKIILASFLPLFLLSFLFFNEAKADLLWNIDQGIGLYQKGQYMSSLEFFNSYLNNYIDDKEGLYWLALGYKASKMEAFSKNNFKKAYEATIKKDNIENNLLQDDSKNETFEDYFDIAVMYFEKENYKEANYYADLMLKINPKSSSAYFIKAKILYVLGDTEEARENLNKAVLYDPKILETNLATVLRVFEVPRATLDFYYGFAYENYFKGEIDLSIEYTKKYLELDPNSQDMLNFLVNLYLKNNEISNAKAIVLEIEEKFPNNIENILNYAKINKKQNKEYKSLLEKAYKINPNKEEVLYSLGEYYFDKGEFQNALKYFENLIQINSSSSKNYFAYIHTLIELKETNKALDGIRKLSKINPEASYKDFLMAKICVLNNEFENAKEYILSAIKKDKNKLYYLELAQINCLLKNYNEAIRNLDEINNVEYEILKNNLLEEKMRLLYQESYLALGDLENAKKYSNEDENVLKKGKKSLKIKK